jgi:hypothetical protein
MTNLWRRLDTVDMAEDFVEVSYSDGGELEVTVVPTVRTIMDKEVDLTYATSRHGWEDIRGYDVTPLAWRYLGNRYKRKGAPAVVGGIGAAVALVAKANLMIDQAVRKASNIAARRASLLALNDMKQAFHFAKQALWCAQDIAYDSISFRATHDAEVPLPSARLANSDAIDILFTALAAYERDCMYSNIAEPSLRAILLKHLQTTKEQEAGHGG